ncbi:unnamed protein product [Effrenium voratum]|uniref:Uncharacterized protein n=1 Tax=Effrenium voratum TaxID=2562239 RepID=A0AA36NLL7_9DINO|nr:unnamed protein product [Effrenium voratum]
MDCAHQVEAQMLVAELSQQRAEELEGMCQQRAETAALAQEASRGADAQADALRIMASELQRWKLECQDLRSGEAAPPAASAGVTEAAAAQSQAQLQAAQENLLRLQEQSVADVESAQRAERSIVALKTRCRQLKGDAEEAKAKEQSAAALSDQLALRCREQELKLEEATEVQLKQAELLDDEREATAAWRGSCQALAAQVELGAASESAAFARAAEVAEEQELLRQEVLRLRDQNVDLVRQMHAQHTTRALQDIKIVAAARST